MFMIGFDGRLLTTSGVLESLRFHGVASIEEQVRRFFAEPSRRAGQLLVGVLPFDREGEVMLSLPSAIRWDAGPDRLAVFRDERETGLPAKPVRVIEVPTSDTYAGMVRDALRMIESAPDEGLRKVVLARALRVEMDGRPDPLTIAGRLSQDADVTVFLASLDADRAIVGATPELLLSRRGLRIVSHPLAGSMPRSPDAAEDRRAADGLLRSDKDRREHALVVEAVLDTLTPYCAQLSVPEGMGLRSTATVWHLGTRIEGVLRSDDAPSAAGLAALLHPTPAVGGYPRDEALGAIRAIETGDRGYYAGAVGWVDGKGDGEWHVSLRCAQIEGGQVLLHAGAGIVLDSEPDAEVVETAAKFRAMLGALGLDEDGRLLEAAA